MPRDSGFSPLSTTVLIKFHGDRGSEDRVKSDGRDLRFTSMPRNNYSSVGKTSFKGIEENGRENGGKLRGTFIRSWRFREPLSARYAPRIDSHGTLSSSPSILPRYRIQTIVLARFGKTGLFS